MYQWLYDKELYFVKNNKDKIPKDIRKHDEEILGGKFLGYTINKTYYCFSGYCVDDFEYYVLYLDMELYRKYYIMRKIIFNHNIKKTIMKKCILKMVRINGYGGCSKENIFENDHLQDEYDIVMYREVIQECNDDDDEIFPDISIDDIYRLIEKN